MTQPTSVLSPAVGGIANLFDLASEVSSRPGEPGGEGAFGNVLSDIAASDAVSSRDGVSTRDGVLPGDAVRLGDLVSMPFAATSAGESVGELVGEAAADGVAMPMAGISGGSTLLENFRIARDGAEGSQIINRLSARQSDVAAAVADSIKTGVVQSSAEGSRVTDPRSMEWVARQPVASRREEFFEVARSTPPTTFTVSEPTSGQALKTSAALVVPAVNAEAINTDRAKVDTVKVDAVKVDAVKLDAVKVDAPLAIDESRLVNESRLTKLPEVALPDSPQDSSRSPESIRKDGADDSPALAVRTSAEQIAVSLGWTTPAVQVGQVPPIVRPNSTVDRQSIDAETPRRATEVTAPPAESLVAVARYVSSANGVASPNRLPATNDKAPVTVEAPVTRTAVVDGSPIPMVKQSTPETRAMPRADAKVPVEKSGPEVIGSSGARVSRSDARGTAASIAAIPMAATAAAEQPTNSASVAGAAVVSRADAAPSQRFGMPAAATIQSRMALADDVATPAALPTVTQVLTATAEGLRGLQGSVPSVNSPIVSNPSVPVATVANPNTPVGLPDGLVFESGAIRAEIPARANSRVPAQAPSAASFPGAASATSAAALPSSGTAEIAVGMPGVRMEGAGQPTPAAMQRASVVDQTRPLPAVTVLPAPTVGQPVLAPAQVTPAQVTPARVTPAATPVAATIQSASATPALAAATLQPTSVATPVETPSSIPTTNSGGLASSFSLGDATGVDRRPALAAPVAVPVAAPAAAPAVTTPVIDAGRSVQAQFVAGAAEFVAARFESVRRPIAARESVGSAVGREFVPLTPSSGTAVATSAATPAATVAAGNRIAEPTAAVSGSNSAAAAQLVQTAPASIAPVVTPEVMTADSVAPFEMDMKSDTWEMDLGDILGKVIDSGEDRAVVKLSPEGLGDLEISVTVREGEVQVAFGAAIAETRAALEQAMPKLRDLLGQGGLELANAGVYSNLPRDAERRDAQPEMTRGNAFRGAEDSVDSEEVASRPRESDGLVDLYA